jgi:hypothetical protein
MALCCVGVALGGHPLWRSRVNGQIQFRTMIPKLESMERPHALAICFKICQDELAVHDFLTDIDEFRVCLRYMIVMYTFINDLWSDLLFNDAFLMRFPGRNVERPPVTSVDEVPAAMELWCEFQAGSFSKMPAITQCVLQHNRTTTHSYLPRCHKNSILITSATQGVCAVEMTYHRAAWLLAKFNYGLILLATMFVIVPSAHTRVQKKGTVQCSLVFAATSVVWMAWRLQENFNWDNKWQASVPYICVATNTLRYLMEGIALFLFSSTSMERYLALAGSFVLRVRRKRQVRSPRVAVLVGATTGGLCSLLNSLVLCFMTSPSALLLKTCSVPRELAVNLVPLIVAKVLSLLVMYLVPCCVMCAANIAVSRSIRRKSNQNLGRCSKKRPTKKTEMISGFLVFSSIFMVCCVSKPIFEVYVAIQIHVSEAASSSSVDTADAIGLILDVITWNLTTVAYVINTVMGLRYTK